MELLSVTIVLFNGISFYDYLPPFKMLSNTPAAARTSSSLDRLPASCNAMGNP
jgi:hypothetical protein